LSYPSDVWSLIARESCQRPTQRLRMAVRPKLAYSVGRCSARTMNPCKPDNLWRTGLFQLLSLARSTGRKTRSEIKHGCVINRAQSQFSSRCAWFLPLSTLPSAALTRASLFSLRADCPAQGDDCTSNGSLSGSPAVRSPWETKAHRLAPTGLRPSVGWVKAFHSKRS
jgi:hypothetical protein